MRLSRSVGFKALKLLNARVDSYILIRGSTVAANSTTRRVLRVACHCAIVEGEFNLRVKAASVKTSTTSGPFVGKIDSHDSLCAIQVQILFLLIVFEVRYRITILVDLEAINITPNVCIKIDENAQLGD